MPARAIAECVSVFHSLNRAQKYTTLYKEASSNLRHHVSKCSRVQEGMRRDRLNDWVTQRLNDLFASKKTTVKQFAKLTEISQRQIHKIKEGDTESTSVENLVRWTMACGVHPSTFFAELHPEELQTARASEDEELLELFRRCLLVRRNALRVILQGLLPDEPPRSQ